ncbi:FAD/FMN-containing dehydrogenase [Paenibacillus uliginis N3/975]|uniref:FAD/FMN-containing dehydrogenase n=1 Tax=Paenibacillus uliginis N3/975 TaxID=1313296 RepID=A0A1X7HL61_9BACL|nr:FAD-binding oxidoreductase [Paenibacillus uliginis]SMF87811.1 FAD/FMN-containing dehydrogenase [Paenibacillus uliginis N3/975]
MFEQLKANVNGRLIVPGEEGYNERRKVWNTSVDKHPAAILVCKAVSDVVAAVKFAKEKGFTVSIRGGGHHVAGTAVCDHGIMIDLSDMRKVTVDTKRHIAIVEAGATLGEVDAETQKFGLATPTGTVTETGIAGLALCGGIGYLRGKYGLTSDNIVSAHIVTAEGEAIQVSEQEHPDLYWAIRGGGGNFGVVTSFEFQLYPIGPEVLAIDVMYDYKDAKQVLHNAQAFLRTAPDEVSFNMMTVQMPAAPGVPESLHNKRVIIIAGLYSGDKADGEKAVQPLRELAQPISDNTGIVRYTELQSRFDQVAPKDVPVYGSSLFVKELNDETIDALLGKLEQLPRPSVLVQFWECHGRMNRVSPDATAFAVRDASFLLLFDIDFPMEEAKQCKEWIDSVYEAMLPYSLRSTSYLNTVQADRQITKDTYGDNYEKLATLKQKYDPTNLFRHNHNIEPQV